MDTPQGRTTSEVNTLWAPSDDRIDGRRFTNRKVGQRGGTKGWIVYSGKTASGDWDLFVMRPDGSHKRNIYQYTQHQ